MFSRNCPELSVGSTSRPSNSRISRSSVTPKNACTCRIGGGCSPRLLSSTTSARSRRPPPRGVDHIPASLKSANRTNDTFRAMKTIALLDCETGTILDVHASTKYPHETRIARQVLTRNLDRLSRLQPPTRATIRRTFVDFSRPHCRTSHQTPRKRLARLGLEPAAGRHLSATVGRRDLFSRPLAAGLATDYRLGRGTLSSVNSSPTCRETYRISRDGGWMNAFKYVRITSLRPRRRLWRTAQAESLI